MLILTHEHKVTQIHSYMISVTVSTPYIDPRQSVVPWVMVNDQSSSSWAAQGSCIHHSSTFLCRRTQSRFWTKKGSPYFTSTSPTDKSIELNQFHHSCTDIHNIIKELRLTSQIYTPITKSQYLDSADNLFILVFSNQLISVGATLPKVMTCCLMAPSHYLNH